jgi:hypothetical protein
VFRKEIVGDDLQPWPCACLLDADCCTSIVYRIKKRKNVKILTSEEKPKFMRVSIDRQHVLGDVLQFLKRPAFQLFDGPPSPPRSYDPL